MDRLGIGVRPLLPVQFDFSKVNSAREDYTKYSRNWSMEITTTGENTTILRYAGSPIIPKTSDL